MPSADEPDVETLGQLVGRMAHDLNNFIATARIGVELATRSHADPQVRRILEGVIHSLGQQQALTHAMARAARACEHTTPLDLHVQMEAAADDLRAALGGAELELRPDAADARIRADARFLHAALVHLAANARAAMPDDGRFLLATRNVTASTTTGPDRRFVLLQAVDNGMGMNEEARAKAFDLFFSAHGGAHGLGLAQVRDMARRAGGSVRLDSGPGQGTVVALMFPLAD